MAYDEALAVRVRALLSRRRGISERPMFGGLAFLLNGHMACGVQGSLLVLRLGPEGAAAALQRPHTRPMDFTGKPLAGMVYVEPDGWRREAELRNWLGKAVRFARGLPPK
jgi:TfoX/Sxy family transcriptional regulator of competence genes